MVLTLMFREYCSLCHQMHAALQPYQAAYGFELQVFDVDEDPELKRVITSLYRCCCMRAGKSAIGIWMKPNC